MACDDDAVNQVMFSTPFRTGMEEAYIQEVLASSVWHGDGPFTKRATDWLLERTGAAGAMLTTSCTHALEMCALLLDLGSKDEVICPSYTFPSTATAVTARGATPVFVDVTADTLNIDPAGVAAAITPATRAIFVVHYGGVAVDLDAILALAQKHDLAVVEDNAHSLGAYFRGEHLGTFGAMGTHSWHDTKNVTSGEGGALLINDLALMNRAEVIREKGTNRSAFYRGEVDKYTWVSAGSSYLPSEFSAAVLMAQFEEFDNIQARRHEAWAAYARELSDWATQEGARLMQVPPEREHPAHLFYVIMNSHVDQMGMIGHLANRGVVATFHYQPLDSSPAGLVLGRTLQPCVVTADLASRLVRLPLHAALTTSDVMRVVEGVTSYRSVTS